MKKESLSTMTVKIFLAVIIFAGMGVIIIGGGCIVWEYSKCVTDNQTTKPVERETENYYDLLEEKCKTICCLDSLKIMKENKYKEADEGGRCPDGFEKNMIKCPSSLEWCRLAEYERILCDPIKRHDFDYNDNNKFPCRDCPDGYFFRVFSSGAHDIKWCFKPINDFEYHSIGELNAFNKFNTLDFTGYCNTEGYLIQKEDACTSDCIITVSGDTKCAKCFPRIIISENNEVISHEKLELTIDELKSNQLKMSADFVHLGYEKMELGVKYRFSLQGSVGRGGNFYFKGIGFERITENIEDTSDWQTYRNEEFGFEVKYPEEWDSPLWQENEYRKGITFGCPKFDFEGNEYCSLSLSISKATTKDEIVKNINAGAYKEFIVDAREAITYYEADMCVETYTKIFDKKMTISFTDRCSVYEGDIFDQILSTFKFID